MKKLGKLQSHFAQPKKTPHACTLQVSIIMGSHAHIANCNRTSQLAPCDRTSQVILWIRLWVEESIYCGHVFTFKWITQKFPQWLILCRLFKIYQRIQVYFLFQCFCYNGAHINWHKCILALF